MRVFVLNATLPWLCGIRCLSATCTPTHRPVELRMMTNPEKPQSESLELHAKRLVELEQRVASMQADLKRQEDLLAWVVDLLEAVQSNALDQARGSESAGATPPLR